MKIAIDSGPIATGSNFGMGVYVRELTSHLKGVDVINFSKEGGLLPKARYDLLHFTRFKPFSISLPFSKPANTKFVLTIYDLIPLVYPKHYPPGVRGWINWQINKFLIRKNVDAIITISETSKKDICRFIGFDPSKVFVTYLAAPEEYKVISDKKVLDGVAKKYKLPSKFVLADADIYYSKNIPNLVEACKIADLPLVLVGGGVKTIEYARSISFNHAELKHLKNVDWGGVIFIGGIDTSTLAVIYNLATVYVQPSYYEGFGLPIIQAVNCGTPLVATKSQCNVEILGPDFNYVDPNDPKDIAKEIKTPQRDVKLPHKYSWKKAASETKHLYEKILAGA